MPIAKSRVTSQGRVSIPAAVREKFGIRPRSTIAWEEEDGKLVVKRSGKYTFEDIRKTLFPDGPLAYKLDEEIEECLNQYFRKRFSRR